MAKRVYVLVAILLLFVLSSCSVLSQQSLPTPLETSSDSALESQKPGAEIAFITTEQRLSSTAGQNVWNTLSRFSGEIGASAVFYTAEADNEEGITSTLELAVKSGAELVITMDGIVTKSISLMSGRYPNVHFIFLDSSHDIAMTQNTAVITFSPEEAGWLSGYAAGLNAENTYAYIATDNNFSQRLSLGYALGLDMATHSYYYPDTDYETQLVAPSALSVLYGLTFPEIADISTQQISDFFASIPNGAANTFIALPFTSDFNIIKDTLFSGVEVTPWPQTDVVSNVTFDPRRILGDVLLSWHNGRFPAMETFTGTIADGDLTIDTHDISDDILNIYEDESVKSTIDAMLSADEFGISPLLEELAFQHIAYVQASDDTTA